MKEILIDTAKKAGRLLLDNFRNDEFSQIAVDKGRFDYSIKMDKMAEDLIVKLLKDNGMKGKIVAEETGEISLGASDYTLYIDPLDGTYNYAHGIPHYAVSIGVEKNGEIVFAVTYDPNMDEMFFAEKGRGAFLNGKKIQASRTSEMGYAIVNLFSRTLKYHPELEKAYVELFKSAYIRMPMSAVLALAYTACGRTDATIGSGHNKWDIAAGVLLVREAGGRVTDEKGSEFNLESPVIVATNNFVHKKILEKLIV